MRNRVKVRVALGILIALVSLCALFIACDSGSSSGGTDTCDTTRLRTIPLDPSVRGPWPAGSKTVTVSGLKTEVWYPAVPGSETGKSKDWIDTREYMPDSDPDPDDPNFQIDSYKDLPIDTEYGPYPVIVYVHGTGSFRTASHALFTHWASRGFVVICADNPGIMFGDIMAGGCDALMSADQEGDTITLLTAVRNQSSGISFLNGLVAADRIGLGGHSAGGMAISGLGNQQGVKVIIPMASGGVEAGTYVESALIMGGLEDNAAMPFLVRMGYNSTGVAKKRLVHIPDAGHMAFCSVCGITVTTDEDLGPLAEIANDGCGPQYMDPALSTQIVNFASTAVYEETLMCSDTAAGQLETITRRFSGVQYRSEENANTGCN